MTDPHMHLPTRDNANVCGVEGCGQPWNSINHQPSLALQRLSELPPDLRPLAQHERASGPPSVPVQRANGAPATHTGRPAMHSGAQYVPSNAKWIMCPERFRTPGKPTLQCPYSSPLRAEVADHLARVHEYDDQPIGFYLSNPWFANEERDAWVKRTRHLRHVTTVQDSDVFEVCTHPNGFGPNGCPCGASAPDEDAPETVRNLDTGKDVPATRCPECQEPVATDLLLLHMREVEASDQEDIDAMAELLGLPTLPTVPKSILDDIEAVGLRAQAELERFMNPDVTMEQIMADAADTPPGNEHKMDPHDLEAALTAWWMDKAEQETRAVVPKAVEYGATDLRDIGRDLADCMGREVTDEEATELGIFFYLRGKLSRWVDAVKRGDRPSDDTIYDIGVYCRMAQRNRDVGNWPGLPKD